VVVVIGVANVVVAFIVVDKISVLLHPLVFVVLIVIVILIAVIFIVIVIVGSCCCF